MYIVGGVSTQSTQTSFKYNPHGTGIYEVGVYAIGGRFDSNGVYCLPSQTCGNNSAYSITLLNSVDESRLIVSIDGRITWTPVDYAISYSVELIIKGASYDAITVYSAAYDLSDLIAYKNVHSLEVKITAHGNSKCVSSETTVKDWPVIIH